MARCVAVAALAVVLLLQLAAPAAAKGPLHRHRGPHRSYKHEHEGHDDKPQEHSCQATSSCVPTVYEYNNLGATDAAPASQWPKCNGPFVLCSVANCSIIASSGTPKVPLQAECGCLAPVRDAGARGDSLVTPNIIKSKAVADATIARCFNGQDPASAGAVNTCTQVNSAPVCKAINQDTMYGGIWPFISTFTLYEDQGLQMCTGANGGSAVADCMTAACYRKRAFDGSPYVCYCPVYSIPAGVKFSIGYPRSKFPDGIPCNQPKGYVISGAATA